MLIRVPPNVGELGAAPKTPSSAMASPGACSEKKCDCSMCSCRSSSTVMPGLPATTTSVTRRPQSASAAPVTIEPKLWATIVSDCSGSSASEATNAVRSLAAVTRSSLHSIDPAAAARTSTGLS